MTDRLQNKGTRHLIVEMEVETTDIQGSGMRQMLRQGLTSLFVHEVKGGILRKVEIVDIGAINEEQ